MDGNPSDSTHRSDVPAAAMSITPDSDDQLAVLRTFVRFDLAAANLSFVGLVLLSAVSGWDALIWLAPASLAVLIITLLLARRPLAAGNEVGALFLVAAGNWVVALAIPIPLPFLWPVLAVTVIIPVVLAAPYLRLRVLSIIVGLGAAVIAGVGTIGLLGDDAGVIDDIDDTLELVVVVATLVVLIVPIAFVVAQTNRLQRLALDRSIRLNSDLTESEHQLAASRRRVVAAGDNERIRIERDLHDGAQQRLVALGVHLRLLESQTADGATPEDLHSYITMLVSEVDLAVDDLRELAHGIYPPLLEARGLQEAFDAVARRSPVLVTVHADDVGRLDPSIETALYFTGLEALTNAAKHAPEASIELSVSRNDAVVRLTVIDDGPGFEPTQVSTSRGTLNMSDRIAAVGGTFSIDSDPGSGTTVTAVIPTDPA